MLTDTADNDPTSTMQFADFIKLVLDENYAELRKIVTSGIFNINQEDFRGATVLHYASELGNLELVNILLEDCKVNVNRTTLEYKTTPLMLAAMGGHAEVVRSLLNHGADPAAISASEYTALMMATESGNLDCVKVILNTGNYSGHIKNSQGKNALMICANSDIFNCLLEFKAVDLEQVDADGFTILHLISQNNHNINDQDFCVLVSKLMDLGISINIQSEDGSTPIMCAMKSENFQKVDFLIKKGANLSLQDNNLNTFYSYTIIHYRDADILQRYPIPSDKLPECLPLAASQGRIEIIKSAFLEDKYNCLDLEIQENEIIQKCLIESASGGNLCCLEFFLERFNEDIEVFVEAAEASLQNHHESLFKVLVDKLLLTAAAMNIQDEITSEILVELLNSSLENQCIEGCKFLLEDLKVNPDGSVNEESGPLLIACSIGDLDIAKVLISYGANVNKVHSQYGSPLILAAANGKLDLVKLLLSHGADTSIADSHGFTAYISATIYGHNEIADEIFKIDRKCIERCSKEGMSALMAAARSGNEHLTAKLLENGANIEHQDINGNSAIHEAVQNMNMDVLKLLLDKKEESVLYFCNCKNIEGFAAIDLLLKTGDVGKIAYILKIKPELAEFIESRSTFRMSAEIEQEMCAICRDDFVLEDLITKLPCRHFFHESCFENWTCKRAACPICLRSPYKKIT